MYGEQGGSKLPQNITANTFKTVSTYDLQQEGMNYIYHCKTSQI
jgi:hypothetical protein